MINTNYQDSSALLRANLRSEWNQQTAQHEERDAVLRTLLKEKIEDMLLQGELQPYSPRRIHINNPVVGDELGSGKTGATVFKHAMDNTLALKMGRDELEHEFNIAQMLDSPYFAKSYKLNQLDGREFTHQIVMERIQGQVMTNLYRSDQKLKKDEVVQILSELKEGIVHLFERDIAWADVNDGNLFMTDEGHLKICDFGCWRKEEDSGVKTKRLLLGAMEAAGWIIKSSQIRTKPVNRDLEFSIMYPKKFFNGTQLELFNVHSMHGWLFDDEEWMDLIVNNLKQMTDQQKLDLVLNYVDQVIEQFKSHSFIK